MIQKYLYDGNEITFKTENGLMVNATQMAKSFGKRPIDFLKTTSVTEYIKTFSVMKNLTTEDLIKVVQGGTPELQGTWMHEDIALEFARWLSPAFAIWCNDRIKELLTTGRTEIDFSNPQAVLQLAQNWAAEQEKRVAAEKQIELKNEQLLLQENTILQQAPKAEYHDNVLQSTSLININVIAKELGMSAVRLNAILHQMGVQYKSGNTWVLYAKYENKGYCKTKTTTYSDSHGISHTAVHTYWTESGRKFIHDFIKNTHIQKQ